MLHPHSLPTCGSPRLPLLYLTCCVTIPTALCLTTCVNLLHLSHRKNRSSAKDVSASPFGDFLPPHPTYFDAQKKLCFFPFRVVWGCARAWRNLLKMLILPSPSSWAPEQSAEDEAAGAPQPPSSRSPQPPFNELSPFPSLKIWISFLSLALFPSALKRSAGGLIWLSEAEVECSSLGISNSRTFCRSLSFLFCHRKGASDDEGRLRRTPSPTRPLSPKTDKRPIFRTLSDKQDLLVEPLPVQITIQRVDEGGRGRIKTTPVD